MKQQQRLKAESEKNLIGAHAFEDVRLLDFHCTVLSSRRTTNRTYELFIFIIGNVKFLGLVYRCMQMWFHHQFFRNAPFHFCRKHLVAGSRTFSHQRQRNRLFLFTWHPGESISASTMWPKKISTIVEQECECFRFLLCQRRCGKSERHFLR